MSATDLYLDLLKRALTDTLYGEEPDHDDPDVARFIQGFLRHYIQGRAHTMVPLARLDNVEACVRSALGDGVPGDLIETCLLYTSPSPRDRQKSRMPSSA